METTKQTKISNYMELRQLLEKKFGKRYELDFFSLLRNEASGSIDSKRVTITFKAEDFLLITVSPDGRDILDELLPIFTEIMGGKNPICSYDLQPLDEDEKDAKPTIEWDVVAPEDRIKQIVNGRAYSDRTKILNLKLYNEKNPSDYIESEQEKEDRIKNARIYGIDPGSISDVEEINNLSEVDLYFAIDALGGHIWRCNHDMYHGRIPKTDLTEEQYAIEYMVYQTKKFGVELPEPEVDKHITPTPSYRAWFEFYHHHFNDVLSNEEWNAFQRAKKAGQDTSSFMPSGHWTDLLEKETKTLQK